MKTLRIFSLAVVLMAFAALSLPKGANAQTKTETFKVSGNCGMCKSKIEKAAKDAGAKSATWNTETKDLTVTFKSSTTNAAKIQEKIAGVGYDNSGAKATTEAYNKLHGCCKYERSTTDKKASCCSDEASCNHDGAVSLDCCKDGKCTKEGHDGKDCCEKMDCCKDGKCTKEGHNAKDCCKKSE